MTSGADTDTTVARPLAIGSFRESTWSNRAVVVALLALLAWRCTGVLPRDWGPPWLVFTVIGIIPAASLLIYALATRQQSAASRLHFPGLKRVTIETAIAVPVAFGCVLLAFAVQSLASLLAPDAVFVPEEFERMARSTGTGGIYYYLLSAVLLAPLVEEVFFRGFLFNAFRKRMPLALAILVQSVIFGFAHFQGWAYCLVTSFVGLSLTLIYLWRKTLFSPMIVHMCMNGLFAAGMLSAIVANRNAPTLGVISQKSETECVIAEVLPGSPAETAGLLAGDTITYIDDKPIFAFEDLRETLATYDTGSQVTIVLTRDGAAMRLSATLVPRSSMSAEN